VVYRRDGLNLVSQQILIMVTEMVIETSVISHQLTRLMAREDFSILATVMASDLTAAIVYLNIFLSVLPFILCSQNTATMLNCSINSRVYYQKYV
jgi:hypothetical protein